MPLYSPETAAELGYLRCSSGGTFFGIPLSSVRSVERPDRIEWNPQSGGPDGWLPAENAMRSQRVPVYGVSGLLNLSAAAQSFGAVVNVSDGPSSWAIGFDHVERFAAQAHADQLRPLPEWISAEARTIFRGVLAVEDSLMLCLDLAGMAPAGSQGDRTTPRPFSPGPTAQIHNLPAGASTTSNGQAQIIRFSVPGVSEHCALSARQVIEFVTSAPTVQVPWSKPELPGIVLWRNQALAILELGHALSGGVDLPASSRLLIVQAGGGKGIVALRVGKLLPSLQNAAAFRPSQKQLRVDGKLLRGVFEGPEGTVLIPDIPAILENIAAPAQ